MFFRFNFSFCVNNGLEKKFDPVNRKAEMMVKSVRYIGVTRKRKVKYETYMEKFSKMNPMKYGVY